MTWTWWAVPGLVTAAIAWTATVILLRTAHGRPLNHRLALVLALEGLWWSGGWHWMLEDPVLYMQGATVGVAAMFAIPFLYLAFLGVAVDTPLVAIFRSGKALLLLVLTSLAAAFSVFISPTTFIGELYDPGWATWNFHFTRPGAMAAQVFGAASLYGLFASLHAYRRARPGSAARSRAKWFAIAFGIRDVFNVGWWLLYPVVRPIPFWGDFLSNQGAAYFTILFLLCLAYGVLRVQLFDLDLKVKLVLRQGTVGAVFAAAFFTGSELLEGLVPVEGTILGLIVAATIVLVLRPVQRFAEGVASRIMPGVEATPAYLDGRRLAVYRAALEGAQEDQVITERERGILVRLREELGISAEAAERLERQVLESSRDAPT